MMRYPRLWGWFANNVGTYDRRWSWLVRLLFCRPCHPERDHCGLPEHDFCIACGQSMPGQAGRPAP